MVYYFNGQRQFKQNRLFTTNQRQFSRTLRERMEKTLPPDPEETTKFWSDLSGVPVQHDDSKEWIKEVAKESAEASLHYNSQKGCQETGGD